MQEVEKRIPRDFARFLDKSLSGWFDKGNLHKAPLILSVIAKKRSDCGIPLIHWLFEIAESAFSFPVSGRRPRGANGLAMTYRLFHPTKISTI
jgi:hypothetical protein